MSTTTSTASPPQSTASNATTPRIGIILSSTRTPRAGPQITTFVQQVIQCSYPNTSSFSLHLIDLATWSLPLFNERTIPQRIHDPALYSEEHTRQWSREISSYSAFVFVTPQYNWGYPAALKNAIDYLFNEWVGKPAMIVSYGGHGGTKCAGQLRQVLQAVEMNPVPTMPSLAFQGKEMLVAAAMGKALGLDVGKGEGGIWGGRETEDILEGFAELLKSLNEQKVI